MARVSLPTFLQVAALPCFLQTRIPAAYEDANGHMNVTGYLMLHDQAVWRFMASLGMDGAYLADARMSIFDLEHHLRYLSELEVGDRISVHARVVARSEKLLHAQFFLLDRDREVLSNTLEFISAHVSLETRRSAPWPDRIARNLDAALAEAGALDWPPPLSGALGI